MDAVRGRCLLVLMLASIRLHSDPAEGGIPPPVYFFDHRDLFEFASEWGARTDHHKWNFHPDGRIDAQDLLGLLSGRNPAAPAGLVEMVDIPAGTFIMGRRDDGDDAMWGEHQELPRHPVTLSAYQIGKYEVTNAQFAEVLNWAYANGRLSSTTGDISFNSQVILQLASSQIEFMNEVFVPKIRQDFPMADHPVTAVNWFGAVAFCNWLSEMEGLVPSYNLISGGWNRSSRFADGYRLPTEAEWERAAAWDGQEHWTYGFDRTSLEGKNRCNYIKINPLGLGVPNTSPVGWFNGRNISPNGNVRTLDSPSPSGCYDMHGNVAEWCEDGYQPGFYSTPEATEVNPLNRGFPSYRVYRGGHWAFYPSGCRSAVRLWAAPTSIVDRRIGFRVAKTAVRYPVPTLTFSPTPTFTLTPTITPTRTFTPTPTPTPVPTAVSIVMVGLPPGSFLKGNPGTERENLTSTSNEFPQHEVTLSYSFEIGRFEVTNHQYAEVLNWADDRDYLMSTNDRPYDGGNIHHNGRLLFDTELADGQIFYSGGRFLPIDGSGNPQPNHPVSNVTWYGAVAYCNWLSEMEGRDPAYDLDRWVLADPHGGGYRLPSESEWEYACRGSEENPDRYSPFSFGDDLMRSMTRCDASEVYSRYMSWCGSPVRELRPVGEREPNDYGLHDMHGNSREWCEDFRSENYIGAPTDGSALGQTALFQRIVRGGSYTANPNFLRSAKRVGVSPWHAQFAQGFRIVRTVVD